MNKIISSLICVVCFAAGVFIGLWICDRDRNTAIRAGVAEYSLNKKTGDVEFHYYLPTPTPSPTPVPTPAIQLQPSPAPSLTPAIGEWNP